MKLIWKLMGGGAGPTLWELYSEEEFKHNERTYYPTDMLAWINQRPNYCDRGHWQGTTELGGMDFADCWPNYYMSLERAKDELTEYTKWRVNKERSANEFEVLCRSVT